jgi:predicted metal-binding transcription factor (methanogenesis marker protein 9)
MLLFNMTPDMLRFLGQGFVFCCKSVAPCDLRRRLLTYLQLAVNDISKYASVTEDLARIAELICRFALTEELYLHGTSKAVEELEKAVVKLYAHILGFLSTAKQYLEQGTVSTYMVFYYTDNN